VQDAVFRVRDAGREMLYMRVSNAAVERLLNVVVDSLAAVGGSSKEDMHVLQLFDNSFNMTSSKECI
jgi:hypothetical protein